MVFEKSERSWKEVVRKNPFWLGVGINTEIRGLRDLAVCLREFLDLPDELDAIVLRRGHLRSSSPTEWDTFSSASQWTKFARKHQPSTKMNS